MSALDAAANVLGAAGTPLRVDEITARVLAYGQWVSKGKTPAATIEAQLAMEIKNHGDASRFTRPAPRTYGLRHWPAQSIVEPAAVKTMSFTGAAEEILAASAHENRCTIVSSRSNTRSASAGRPRSCWS